MRNNPSFPDRYRLFGLSTLLILMLGLLSACQTAETAPVEQTAPTTTGHTAAKSIPAAPSTRVSEILEWESSKRSFIIRFPSGFDKTRPAPMVLVLHGGGGQADKFEKHATGKDLGVAADKRGVVLVFAQGMNNQWSDGRTQHLKSEKPYDDVGFLCAVVDHMVARYGVDPKRVYATGISNGGFMSYRLAMDASHKIAAVAPVTAQISKAIEKKKPAHPISIMIFNGTKDPLVPYYGGHVRIGFFGKSRGEILSTDATVDFFRQHNKCNEQPEVTKHEDKVSTDGATAESFRYTKGTNGTEVILVKITGGGHTWPGGAQYLRKSLVGAVCRDINACEMILDFFLQHAR